MTMDTQNAVSPHDWHPADVKARLEKQGVTLRQLAREHGYAHFQRVLTTHWWAAEQIVAKALGVSAKEIWPSRYTTSRDRAKGATRKITVDRKGRIKVGGAH